MGLGCCSNDKNSRQGKSSESGFLEGGSNKEDSMMDYHNQKRRPHLRPQEMHLKNNEFRR